MRCMRVIHSEAVEINDGYAYEVQHKHRILNIQHLWNSCSFFCRKGLHFRHIHIEWALLRCALRMIADKFFQHTHLSFVNDHEIWRWTRFLLFICLVHIYLSHSHTPNHAQTTRGNFPENRTQLNGTNDISQSKWNYYKIWAREKIARKIHLDKKMKKKKKNCAKNDMEGRMIQTEIEKVSMLFERDHVEIIVLVCVCVRCICVSYGLYHKKHQYTRMHTWYSNCRNSKLIRSEFTPHTCICVCVCVSVCVCMKAESEQNEGKREERREKRNRRWKNWHITV